MDRKLIGDAVNMVKNIPATDILVPLQQEEGNLTPLPKIKYDVLFHTSLDKLIKDVNKKLEQGWQTEGGIQVSNGASVMYYQTLIRGNVDSGLRFEMPSKNSEAEYLGSQAVPLEEETLD